jgi:hypothetical protein
MAIVLDGTNGINTPDLESAGPVSGTTGTFSGALQASGVTTNIYPLVSATAVTASGTSVDFTGIPSWVRRITVMFSGVSTNGTSSVQVQLGDSGGVETTGYSSYASWATVANQTAASSSTTGLHIASAAIVSTRFGIMQIALMSANAWVSSHSYGDLGGTVAGSGGGAKTLSDTLTQIRITTVNGTDTFDAGSINILYE